TYLYEAVNFLQIAIMAGEIWSHCEHTVFLLQVTNAPENIPPPWGLLKVNF
ncbi:unnamed protein product, partial [Tetraodon nigroviridis]